MLRGAKVIRSNNKIAITRSRIARLRLHLITYRVSSRHRRYAANVQGQRSRSQRKVMYEQQKSYNTAMDSFSDFKLGMAS